MSERRRPLPGRVVVVAPTHQEADDPAWGVGRLRDAAAHRHGPAHAPAQRRSRR